MPQISKRFAFDIETMADPTRVAAMPELEIKLGNLKDPAKIKAKEEESRAAQLSRAALDPHFARTLAIGTSCRDEKSGSITTSVFILKKADEAGSLDDEERDLLEWFWDEIRKHNKFVTYNGCGFDIPFLMRRSLLLGVRPAHIPIGKYQCRDAASEHLDLFQMMDAWDCGPCHAQTLQFFVKSILGATPTYDTELDKSGLGELWKAGDTKAVWAIAGWDVEQTLMLSEKLERHYRV